MSEDRASVTTQRTRWWQRLWPDRKTAQKRRENAWKLYGCIVARARDPLLYSSWHVPDTHDGRFEAIGFEAILVMRSLRQRGFDGQTLAQELFDVMIVDMDHSVREHGVGDLSVGKYVKRLAGSFLARAQDLDAPLNDQDLTAVEALLRRYLFGPSAAEPSMQALATYLIQTDEALMKVSTDDLLEGGFDKIPPATAFSQQCSDAASS